MKFIKSIICFILINGIWLVQCESDSSEPWYQQKQLTTLIKNSWDSVRAKSLVDFEQTNENENSCIMKINADLIMSKKRETFTAYAGNGFNYAIGCDVFDPKIRAGDKYYVIDLIVYGPNTRVAKAWREQFSTSSISKTKNLALSRNLSFNWLGLNNIVCSVSKYNNLANKFTRICQKSNKINVLEKPNDEPKPSGQNRLEYNELFKMASLHKQIWSSSKPTSKSYSFKSTDEFSFTTTTDDQFEKTNHILLKSLNVDNQLADKVNKSESSDVSASLLNVSAKAMQYRDLNEVSGEEKKLISTSLVNAQTKEEKNSAKKRFVQPLTVMIVFLIVFSVSVGTLIYSTFRQKIATKQYRTVKQTRSNDKNEELESIKISESKMSSQMSNSDIQESLDSNESSHLKENFSSTDEISSID